MTPFWDYAILLRGNYPPDRPSKHRRSNYDPVLELYYYKSIWEPDPRTKKWETTLQESMGARGVQTLDANFDKSFVTPVWNFVVVSPGTISWNNWGGTASCRKYVYVFCFCRFLIIDTCACKPLLVHFKQKLSQRLLIASCQPRHPKNNFANVYSWSCF